MGKLHWYKRDPDAALSGMMELTLEERGAYNTVLDLIYSRDGNLPDDDRFIAGWLRVDVRVWKRLRERLFGLGKLYLDGGNIRNKRADVEVLAALSRVASAQDAGRTSARIRGVKSGDLLCVSKDLAPTTVPTEFPKPLELTTTTPTKKEKERETATPLRWSGEVMKITDQHFTSWQEAAPDIDLRAWLMKRDTWLASLPADDASRKRWFVTSANALANEQQKITEEKRKAKADQQRKAHNRRTLSGMDYVAAMWANEI